MSQDPFTNLPSDIIIDILSRLPIPTIASCKCICKSWLDLLNTHHFINHHLSKSSPGLAVYHQEFKSQFYQIFNFKDDQLDDHHHEHRYDPITNFKLPFDGLIQGSANGLLLLRDLSLRPNGLFICNPITGEYVDIHCPPEFNYAYPQVVTFGFGASKITGQHKVVRVFHDCIRDQDTYKLVSIPRSDCQVYTLGTGSWRSVAPGAPFAYSCRSIGAFVNGNLHWLVFDQNEKPMVSCFDLETEEFTAFAAPAPSIQESSLIDVFGLGDSICVSDNSSDNEIVIWLMKEYGDEKSWCKEFVISKMGDMGGECYEIVRPIKVFKDGDMLVAWGDFYLFYYSGKTRTTDVIDMFEGHSFGAIDSILHTSSFLSLESLGMENVCTFSY